MKICTYLSARTALDIEMNGLRLEYDKKFASEFPDRIGDPLAVERRYRAYFLRRDFHNILLREWVIGIRELSLALFQKSVHRRHLDRVNTVRWQRRGNEINSLIRDSPLAKPMGRPRKKIDPKKDPKKPKKKLTRMERYWKEKGGEAKRERAKRGTGKRPKPDRSKYEAAMLKWTSTHVPPPPVKVGAALRDLVRDRGRDRYIRFLKKEMGRK